MNRVTKLSLAFSSLLILSACSSGGGDGSPAAPPTNPETVFKVFNSGLFSPGYTGTTNYTGTDTAGGVFTATISTQTQSESTFLGVPAIPILQQLQLTNTASGAFISVVGTSYFSPEATSRHYLGYSGDSTTTVSSITETIPQTAKIGNFGIVGTYTDNAGNVDVQSWRIDDAGGGNAYVVKLSTERDQYGNLTYSEVTTTKIDANGNALSEKMVLFVASENITVTLNSN